MENPDNSNAANSAQQPAQKKTLAYDVNDRLGHVYPATEKILAEQMLRTHKEYAKWNQGTTGIAIARTIVNRWPELKQFFNEAAWLELQSICGRGSNVSAMDKLCKKLLAAENPNVAVGAKWANDATM